MSLKSDLEEAKKEVQEIKEQSIAMELLQDYKKVNKRQFITIITLCILWFLTCCIFVYYISNYTYEEEVITETATTDDGGNACVGDNCNNGEINYGESD